MKRKKQQTTFEQVPIGGTFYTGVGHHVKRSSTEADYFGLSTRNDRQGEQHSPEEVVFVEAEVSKP